MAKIARLVGYAFLTRVIVDENATQDEIVAASKQNILDSVNNDLGENLDVIMFDDECPYNPDTDS